MVGGRVGISLTSVVQEREEIQGVKCSLITVDTLKHVSQKSWRCTDILTSLGLK